MIRSHVEIVRPTLGETVLLHEVTGNGVFEIETEAKGLVIVRLAGVHHEPMELPVVLDDERPFAVKARLATYRYVDIDSLDHVGLVGDFTRWDLRSQVHMQPDFGDFHASFKREDPILGYQLSNIVPGRTVNGTDAADYVYDGGGDYRSVVLAWEGLATITFDPDELVRSDAPPVLELDDSYAYVRDLVPIFAGIDDRRARYDAVVRAAQSAGTSYAEAVKGIGGDVAGRIAAARSETKPEIRKALFVAALQVVRMEGETDQAFFRECLAENPPDSPYWSLAAECIGTLVMQLGGYPAQRDLLEAFIEKHPDPEVRRTSLVRAIGYADEAHLDEEVVSYNDRLQKEYPGSAEAAFAKGRLEATVRRGSPAPPFSVASLEDSTRTLTNADFSGKTTLIDFWATWCGPCVKEMDTLHRAYAEFHDRGFEILSVSLDRRRDAIEPFRGRWPMPWQHVFLDTGFRHAFAKAYGVTSIPMPVLVGPSGEVLALGRELRGENLSRTLDQVLDSIHEH